MADNDDKGFFDRLGEILNAPLPGTKTASTTPAPAAPGSPQDDDGGLLERIRDILSTPLPGTTVPGGGTPGGAQAAEVAAETQAQGQPMAPAAQSGTPVPGEAPPAAQAGVPQPTQQMAPSAPDLSKDALSEDWWQRDWAAFKAHRSEEGRGFDLKQEQDRAKLAAFQGQEQQRFAAHQQQEEAMFRQHQQWKLNVWHQYQQALQSGRQVPPPPFALPPNAPPGAPMPPGMMPPWMPPGGPMPGQMGGPRMPPPPWMRRPR